MELLLKKQAETNQQLANVQSIYQNCHSNSLKEIEDHMKNLLQQLACFQYGIQYIKSNPNTTDQYARKLAERLKYEINCFGNIVEIKSYRENLQIYCYEGGYVFNNYANNTFENLLYRIEGILDINQYQFKSDLFDAIPHGAYNRIDNIITWNDYTYSIEYYNNKYNLWNEYGVEIKADEDLNKVLAYLYSLNSTTSETLN